MTTLLESKPAVSIFRFFASLKLAVMVILSLMAAMAAGTFIESAHGADAAKIVVYNSWWFNLILVFLGISVLGAALSRLPWKKKHIGFVITHAGILTILFGSFLTQKLMIDGQMILEEGETEYRITLPEPLIYVYSEKTEQEWIIPLKKKPFAWSGSEDILKGNEEMGLPFQIQRIKDYPKSYIKNHLIAAPQGPAALQVTLESSFVKETQSLLENHPQHGKMQLGPATIRFSDQKMQETKAEAPEAGYLEFQSEDQSIRIPLKPDTEWPQTFALEGTDYEVEVQRVLRSAFVFGSELRDTAKPDEDTAKPGKNPAAVMLVKGSNLEEKHTVFAKFPEFPTRHGMQPSQTGFRILYRLPGTGSRGESHELRFVKSGEGLLYQIQDGFKVMTGKVVVGEQVPLGWMDLKFKVDAYHEHGDFKKEYYELPNVATREDALPAIQIEVGDEKESKRLWLGQGLMETLDVNDSKYHFMYGQRRLPTEFKLTLKDFRKEDYPGTNQPASFESDVTLRDDARGVLRDVKISMNEPLVHRGFRIYQSGYDQTPGMPEVSIFSVGKDPGVPWNYAGTIIMVTGIILMFYTRKFSTTSGRKP